MARWKTAWLLRKTIKKYKPDVVHFLVEPYTLAVPALETVLTMPPWAMNLHGTYVVQPFASRILRPVFARVYAHCHGFFVCSEYTRMRALKGITEYIGTALARSVDARMFPFRLGIDVPPAEQAAGRGKEKHILFVGEVKPRKGVLELIQATIAYHIIATVPWRLDIIGGFKEGDPYIQELRALIQKHHLEKNIILRGHMSDAELKDAYSKADLFMMLSKNDGLHFEGFGLVFLEANSRGIPTIGSNDSGCKEAIDEGKTGYAVDVRDSEKIAEKMQWVLEEQKIKSEDCIAWAKKHSLKQQAESAVAMYKALLKQP
jgi:glycosyltransferase involved in cell wall biosynthesis